MSCCNCQLVKNFIPVFTIIAIVGWSYYAYVVELCVNNIESYLKKAIFLVVYHILFLMFFWAYFAVICSDIAEVPIEFQLPNVIYEKWMNTKEQNAKSQLLEEFCRERRLTVYTRTSNNHIRFCDKCKQIKPDRAHHCGSCDVCVLKMDHHCPWVNNCVGFSNYKLFITFLFYASLYCIFYACTTLEYVILFWASNFKSYNQLHVLAGFIVSGTLGPVLVGLWCYHIHLVINNCTTLEALRTPIFYNRNQDLTFDMGCRENFQEVFGEACCIWFLPIQRNLGDGAEFEVRNVDSQSFDDVELWAL